MDTLTEQQVKQYNKEGYVAPIDALTKEQALSARKEIEIIEKKMPNEINKSGRYNVHLISPMFNHFFSPAFHVGIWHYLFS